MKSFFKYLSATILGIFLSLLLVIGIVLIIAASSEQEVTVKDNSILTLKLNKPIKDKVAENPFEGFDLATMTPKKELTLKVIIESIQNAQTNPKIKGIFLNMSMLQAGLASIEEIRNALIEFKASGKFIISYSEIYDQKSYYLASVSNQIYMNPLGYFGFKGFSAELLFFKDAMEKIGIEPVVIRHGEYKGAVEPFLYNKMSDENREQITQYMGSIWEYIVGNIGNERKISIDTLHRYANDLSTGDPNKIGTLGLIDDYKYYDEVIDEMADLANLDEGKELDLISLSKYSSSIQPDFELTKDKIAIIYASGTINGGKSGNDNIGSESLSKDIRDARKDSTIKAIILRVNSPGGSALASDVIWRELELAKHIKPVYVSMGDVAASGGYYISAPAHKIYASPTTITGSIGVYGLLFTAEKLFKEKLGIQRDSVLTNTFADYGSIFRKMTETEKEILRLHIENIYQKFVGHVADGREKSFDEIDNIAKGKVWSGIDALDVGLINQLGGLQNAIDDIAEEANLDKYRIITFPKQKETLEAIMESFSEDIELKILEKNLGNNYIYYKSLQDIISNEGIMALMPYEISIK